ncbi:MAG: hypothetical protein AAGC46_01645 [Solirubrobacteraceae bacterium]|nr:hypothetical protein [Patulibacter sp.]
MSARARLDQLLVSRDLPENARIRVLDRLRQLERFPRSGRAVNSPEWDGARVLFGPWWFVIVYVFDAATDTVIVTTVEDARSATGASMGGR